MAEEDTTEDLKKKCNTKPTIETVLELLDSLGQEMRASLAAVQTRMDRLEDGVYMRLDRMEAEVKITHSEIFTIRADFREYRKEFQEFRAQFKEAA